ncbi:transposase [Vibrio splendidus]
MRLCKELVFCNASESTHFRTDFSCISIPSGKIIRLKAYLDFGVEGLVEKPHTGRPSRLTIEQKKYLKEYVTSNAIKPEGGRLQGSDITQFILDEFDISYQPSGVYRLLHELNLSWITTRSKHPKQSEKAQESFKKIPNRNDP